MRSRSELSCVEAMVADKLYRDGGREIDNGRMSTFAEDCSR